MKENKILKFKNKDLDKNSSIDNIEILDIEDIETDLDNFYIDKDIIESIEVPTDLEELLDKVIENADKKEKQIKIKRRWVYIASFIFIITSMGIYNQALAHKIPFLYNILLNINENLNIEKISKETNIDKIIPKVKVDEDGKLEVINLNVVKEKDVVAPNSEYSTINLIHEMSNSIIKADKIWGYTEITPKTIDIAITAIEDMSDSEVKSYLRDSLNMWRNGDFSNAKDVHNYVWDLLNGNIGKATGLNQRAIRKLEKRYFNK